MEWNKGWAAWMFCGLLLGVGTGARAQGSPQTTPTQYTNGLSGATSIAAATSGIVDKSYAAIGTVAAQVNRGAFDASTEIQPTYAGFLRPYFLQLGVQTRFGAVRPTWSPDILFSSLATGLDIGYQRFEGEVRGDGVAIRFDPMVHDRNLASQLLRLFANAPQIQEASRRASLKARQDIETF